MTPSPEFIADLAGRRIVVIGDLILDRYLSGTVPRISPEAPVPVLHVQEDEDRVGGAANVAANLTRLGARVDLIGLVGRDSAAAALKELVKQAGISTRSIRVDAGRPTVQKTRLMARNQQMLRVDREEAHPATGAIERKLADETARRVADADAVILSDYAKGVLVPAVIEAACSGPGEVFVDPKTSDVSLYRGAHVITPNAREAEQATGEDTAELDGCREAARAIARKGRFRSVVITRGALGMYFWSKGGEEGSIPTRARGVFDVTGAGDTVIATLALARAAGRPFREAMELANVAAGVVVDRPGAASITPEELAAALSGSSSTLTKVVAPATARDVARRQRGAGRQVVFTNGCFDLLHAGHVESLEYARAQGDFLVVAVNEDASVRRQKGEARPVQALASRMRMLAGLQCVDLVFAFGEDTPEAAIHCIEPDILVKGEDWKGRGVVGGDWVIARGGRVVFAPLVGGHSTTRIIAEVQSRAPGRSGASQRGVGGPTGSR